MLVACQWPEHLITAAGVRLDDEDKLKLGRVVTEIGSIHSLKHCPIGIPLHSSLKSFALSRGTLGVRDEPPMAKEGVAKTSMQCVPEPRLPLAHDKTPIAHKAVGT